MIGRDVTKSEHEEIEQNKDEKNEKEKRKLDKKIIRLEPKNPTPYHTIQTADLSQLLMKHGRPHRTLALLLRSAKLGRRRQLLIKVVSSLIDLDRLRSGSSPICGSSFGASTTASVSTSLLLVVGRKGAGGRGVRGAALTADVRGG